MKILITFFLISIFSNQYTYSQSETWVRNYGSSDNAYDEGVDVVSDKFGNIFVTGNSITDEISDIVLIKYNSNGEHMWTRIYDGNFGDDRVQDMDIGPDGNVCLTGYSENTSDYFDYITIKFSADGNILWVKRHEDPHFKGAIASSLFVDNNNFVFVAGIEMGWDNVRTIKYSPEGDTIWTTRWYGTGGGYSPISISVDEEDILVSKGFPGSLRIYHYNSLGIGISVSYSSGILLSNKSTVLKNNIFCVTGTGNSPVSDYFVQRGGQRRYYDCMGTDRSDSARTITLDNSGNIYITGSTCDSMSCFISTVKYDSNLVFKWERIYNTSTNFFSGGYGILSDKSDNIYITGASDDYLTIKFRPNGDSVWTKNYNGTGNGIDVANAIALDSSGNVIITGRSQVSGDNYNIVTVKYSNTVGVNSYETVVPENFILLQNYPNPFNPITNISYNIPATYNIKLEIHDVQGKLVTKLVNSLQRAGTYKVNFDGSNVSSGIYFCSLFADNDMIDSKKILLLK